MTPPTPIRDDSIYVSHVSRMGLRYVADAIELEGRADTLADQIIANWLKANHPKVIEHIKARWEADKLFKDGLMLELTKKPFVKP